MFVSNSLHHKKPPKSLVNGRADQVHIAFEIGARRVDPIQAGLVRTFHQRVVEAFVGEQQPVHRTAAVLTPPEMNKMIRVHQRLSVAAALAAAPAGGLRQSTQQSCWWSRCLRVPRFPHIRMIFGPGAVFNVLVIRGLPRDASWSVRTVPSD